MGSEFEDGGLRVTVLELDETLPYESGCTPAMASFRAFVEPENEVARLSKLPDDLESSAGEESYAFPVAGSEMVDSIDFRLDMRRCALYAKPPSMPVGVDGEMPGESGVGTCESIWDRGLDETSALRATYMPAPRLTSCIASPHPRSLCGRFPLRMSRMASSYVLPY